MKRTLGLATVCTWSIVEQHSLRNSDTKARNKQFLRLRPRRRVPRPRPRRSVSGPARFLFSNFWKMENRKIKATHGLFIACTKTF
jgi:hypothetical protein